MSVLADVQPAKPALGISLIRIKPGHFEEFMALQVAHLERIRGTVPGVRGGRMFKSTEKNTIVLVSAFETAADAERFRSDPRFQEHVARTGALIESNEALPVELAYAVGLI
jgi:quinol monooxygenase YgiN